jgi:hypothetical protein
MKPFLTVAASLLCVVLFTGATWLPLFKSAGGGGDTPGQLLLSDGVSFILQTDGTSRICLAGGCPATNQLLVAGGTFKVLLVDGLSKICLAGGC